MVMNREREKERKLLGKNYRQTHVLLKIGLSQNIIHASAADKEEKANQLALVVKGLIFLIVPPMERLGVNFTDIL